MESSDHAVICKNLEGVILIWNAGAQRMFGYTKEEAVGNPITIIVPPELLHEEEDILRRLRRGEHIKNYETVRVAKDERRISVTLSISPIKDAKRRIIGAAKCIHDITERKRTEAALRESEERFRLVANTAPVVIWMSGPDRLFTYLNERWVEFSGRSLKSGLGTGLIEDIHPDDLERCSEIYKKAFDLRKPFQMAGRFRRSDGEYRWILNSGVPKFNADGSFAGYIGSCVEITERRRAEEALSTLSQRLIDAQEKERTRIARELHDDINQRLSLLVVSLDRVDQILPDGAAQAKQGIESVTKQLKELSNDLQTLSHRLHSSKLEHLGLAGAAASFCRELAGRQTVKIDFRVDNVPARLSQDVSLCLFRVLQEALQNAVKHSRSQRFEVALDGGSGEVNLSVRDFGIGFDPDKAMRRGGLGLTSMRERLKLVNGLLSIDSQRERGTTVLARVPIKTKAQAASA